MDTALIVTIVLAFVGYVAKYINDTQNYRREKKLERINQRLNLFYGPLYFQTIAGQNIEKMLLKKFGMKDKHDTLDEKHYGEWRLFVIEVLMPLNLMREKVILENSYLMIEDEVPQCLVDFITHVSAFKAVVAKWQTGDFSENFPMIYYPEDLPRYITSSYESLKKEQLKLIGK